MDSNAQNYFLPRIISWYLILLKLMIETFLASGKLIYIKILAIHLLCIVNRGE